jgi:hypothetical protein
LKTLVAAPDCPNKIKWSNGSIQSKAEYRYGFFETGVHELRFVRRYLERAPRLALRQVDPLIRELVHYRDLINLRTKEPEDEPH